MAKTKKRSDLLDVEVGRRIRVQRIAKGITQSDLGRKVGVTFQQIQKYEKGTNRVGAGRLTRIASVLGVPVTAFFSEISDAAADPVETLELSYLSVPGAVRLVKAYSEIQNASIRRALISLAEAAASDEK